MTLLRRLNHLMTSVLLSLIFAACGDDGVDGPVDMTCTDIVTFEGNDGSDAVFTFQKVDDTPLITLTARTTIDEEEIPVGKRLLIYYNPPENQAYKSGEITLLGAKRITQSTVATEWSKDFADWDRDRVYLYSTWRSGNYLNVHVRLTYSTEPRIFCLAADPQTLDSEWPDVYLIHKLASETDSHDRAYYASFDLTPVWERQGVKGIRLHVANSNLDKHIFTFARQQ